MSTVHLPEQPTPENEVARNRETFLKLIDDLPDRKLQEKMDWMIDRLARIMIARGVIKNYKTAHNTAAFFFRQCVVKEVAAGCSFLELTETGRENAVSVWRK